MKYYLLRLLLRCPSTCSATGPVRVAAVATPVSLQTTLRFVQNLPQTQILCLLLPVFYPSEPFSPLPHLISTILQENKNSTTSSNNLFVVRSKILISFDGFPAFPCWSFVFGCCDKDLGYSFLCFRLCPSFSFSHILNVPGYQSWVSGLFLWKSTYMISLTI